MVISVLFRVAGALSAGAHPLQLELFGVDQAGILEHMQPQPRYA
jgi:hypothetical protein